MKQPELKPCKCGKSSPVVLQDKFPMLTIHRRACMILCENFLCGHEVIAFGFTKQGTYKKAVKAWNGGAEE